MTIINPSKVPLALAERPQWCLWKLIVRNGDKPTKLPYQINGEMAKSDDPTTWTTFEAACTAYDADRHNGIGYVFAADDPFVGIDLDGCRNPASGEYAEWAREIIKRLDTYAELSPSETGVKLWLVGSNPLGERGRKAPVPDVPMICDKMPAIEIYDRKRYFAVTGWKLQGVPETIESNKPALDWLVETYFATQESSTTHQDWHGEASVIERARKYLHRLPPSVSGSGGHNAAFHAACVLVMGFGLPEGVSLDLMQEWNQTCQPPWSERELVHKIRQAGKQSGERNYLRNASPQNWDKRPLPRYLAPPPEPITHEPISSTLQQSMKLCLDKIRDGKTDLCSMGLSDLDYALGGGVDPGEMIVMAARPSHGKSALALQCVHHWTFLRKKVLLISEEMSAMALGKRTLQFFTDVAEEDWETSISQIEADIAKYASSHVTAFIAEGCGSCKVAIEQIERHVLEHQIEAVVVDYAQILKGEGKSRYDQLTNLSTAMKQVAAKHKLILVLLCQLNRSIETRNKFVPVMSDIKESGQFEQDADVILFLVWPHRIDSSNPPEEYQIYVAKNRNRAITKPAVICRFKPSRQMILPSEARQQPNYERGFDSYNNNPDGFQ